MLYDQAFFDMIRPGCQASAAVVVPLVFDLVKPATVIDVGCGEGHWGKAFEDHGCKVTGVDGAGTRSVLETFVPLDLGRSLRAANLGTFDLAVSLEVAEHLAEPRSAGFITDLCSLAPVVLFSAAIPGQGGVGHKNEQWPTWWADKFDDHGYAVSGALRWQIWTDYRVKNWYRQNLLLATSDPSRFPELFNTPMAEPFSVIHPVLWDSRR